MTIRRLLRLTGRSLLWCVVICCGLLAVLMFVTFCVYHHAGALVAMVACWAASFMAYACLGVEAELAELERPRGRAP